MFQLLDLVGLHRISVTHDFSYLQKPGGVVALLDEAWYDGVYHSLMFSPWFLIDCFPSLYIQSVCSFHAEILSAI